jgi:hypothetical protein
MNRVGLRAGGAPRLPIDRKLGMIKMALGAKLPTGFILTSLPCLPSNEEGGEQLIERLRINAAQDAAIRHLARHLLASEPKVFSDLVSSMTNPFGGSPQGGLARQFGHQ